MSPRAIILGCMLATSVGCGTASPTEGGTDAGVDADLRGTTDASTDGGTDASTDGGTDASTDGGTDASTDASTDGGTVSPCAMMDAGMMAMPATALTVAIGSPDLSCLGTATAPIGGATTSATLTVTEYVSMTAIGSTPVELFTNDTIMGACAGASCVMGTTNAMGVVTMSAPAGSWVGIHLRASAGTAETLAYNQVWPSTVGGHLATAGFSTSTIGLVTTLLGRTFQPTTAGAILGQVTDCAGQSMANAEARVFHGATRVVSGPSCDHASPRIAGLQGTTPTRSGLTGTGGTFVGANVPPGDDYHVEIWGVATAGGSPELIGCEQGRVVAGGISVLTIAPLRHDYVAGSPCALAAAAHGH